MSTKETRHKIFQDTLSSLSISQGGVAKWMYQVDTKTTRKYISRKNTGEVTATPSDIALVQALLLLQNAGYDLKSVEYSDDGELIKVNRQSIG